MGLPGRFGPLGGKWEKEIKKKGGSPHGPLGAHVRVRLPPLGRTIHVGIVPHGLAKGKGSPFPLYHIIVKVRL